MAARRPKPARVRPRASSANRRTARRPTNDGVVTVTFAEGHALAVLDRPSEQNRLSPPMALTLMELAETVEDDPTIISLAITGAGSVFCAGFDPGVDRRLAETLALVSKPTVAIINGDAYDEGLELALALDLRATLADARLALTQLNRGDLPHFGGTQRLPRLIGATQALLMIVTGTPVSGREAMQLGLVTYLAENGTELDKLVRELLTTLASRGTLGVRMVKDAVRKGSDMTLEQGIRLEEDLYALLQTSADRAEGVRAFLEKRKPLFKGA